MTMPVAGARSPLLSRPANAAALAVLAVLAIAAAVLLQCHVRGIAVFGTESFAVKTENMEPESGRCWLADVRPRWWSGHDRPSPARLYEDGRKLGPRDASHANIRNQGGGRFSLWHGKLFFSTPDGSDPRSNGRKYVLTGPRRVHDGVLYLVNAAAVGLLLLAWTAVRRSHGAALARRSRLLRRALEWSRAGDGVGAWRVCALVAAVALVARIVAVIAVFSDPASHVSGALVMGVPFSDAQGWDALGESVMRGNGLAGGWSARRPFMAIATGALYLWTGAVPMAVVAAQVVLGALGAALVCRIGQRAVHPVAGLVGGLAFAFDPMSLEYCCYTASETLGTFLFLLGLDQFLAALQTGRRSASWWAGVNFALSNLTRTLTLLAGPLLLLGMLLGGRGRGRTLPARIALAALFAVGAALPLGTWIVRQKLVHDLTTISDNTASGLYAAASPKYGAWNSECDIEADAAGIPPDIKPRYEWFMRRFREELAAHPGFWLRNAAGSAWSAFLHLADAPLALSMLTALLLLGMWSFRERAATWSRGSMAAWTTCIALAVPAVMTWPKWTTAVTAAGGAAVALLLRPDRRAWALAAGGASVIAAVGLFGLGNETRLLQMISWMVPLWVTAGILWAGVRAAGGTMSWPDPGPVHVPAWQRLLVRGFLAVFAVSLGMLCWRTFVRPLPPDPPLPVLTSAGAQEALAALERMRPGSVTRSELDDQEARFRDCSTDESRRSNQGRLVVAHGRLSRYRYPVPRWLENPLYSRMFEARGYARQYSYANCVMAQPGTAPSILVMAEPVPEASWRDLLLIGRYHFDPAYNYEESSFEVLAWAPFTEAGRADLLHLQVTRVPEHAALIDGLRP